MLCGSECLVGKLLAIRIFHNFLSPQLGIRGWCGARSVWIWYTRGASSVWILYACGASSVWLRYMRGANVLLESVRMNGDISTELAGVDTNA